MNNDSKQIQIICKIVLFSYLFLGLICATEKSPQLPEPILDPTEIASEKSRGVVLIGFVPDPEPDPISSAGRLKN